MKLKFEEILKGSFKGILEDELENSEFSFAPETYMAMNPADEYYLEHFRVGYLSCNGNVAVVTCDAEFAQDIEDGFIDDDLGKTIRAAFVRSGL